MIKIDDSWDLLIVRQMHINLALRHSASSAWGNGLNITSILLTVGALEAKDRNLLDIDTT